MRLAGCLFCFLLVGVPLGTWAGQQNSPGAAFGAPVPETQNIDVSKVSQEQLRPLASEPGYMDPAALKQLLHKVWLAEYRINDLLTQVTPERWKMSEGARASFLKTLETLRTQMDSLEQWRAQFERRTESVYLGYQTYVAINTLLPRLEGIGRDISRFENPSLGVQFSHAGNQLFDLQQALEPNLSFLLRNQDQILYTTESNLAGCQNQLTAAMRGCTEPAKPMKNILPEFKGRRARAKAAAAAASSAQSVPKASSHAAAPRPGQAGSSSKAGSTPKATKPTSKAAPTPK